MHDLDTRLWVCERCGLVFELVAACTPRDEHGHVYCDDCRGNHADA